MSQKKQRNVFKDEAFVILIDDYTSHHDPVEKAKRSRSTVKPVKTTGRTPFTAAQRHAVNLATGRRCQGKNADGTRCGETRFTAIHHKILVCEGGTNDPGNLTVLCWRCHDKVHNQVFKIDGEPIAQFGFI